VAWSHPAAAFLTIPASCVKNLGSLWILVQAVGYIERQFGEIEVGSSGKRCLSGT
jgi:hypothetical protein